MIHPPLESSAPFATAVHVFHAGAPEKSAVAEERILSIGEDWKLSVSVHERVPKAGAPEPMSIEAEVKVPAES